MVSAFQDLTLVFNAQGYINVDFSQYDYVLFHIIGPSATINFNSSIDGGGVTGSTDGNATSATNWTSCIATNQATNTTATSTNSGNSIWEFNVVGRFIQLNGGAGVTCTKLLVMYAKIQ
jgi:hypothetical protein